MCLFPPIYWATLSILSITLWTLQSTQRHALGDLKYSYHGNYYKHDGIIKSSAWD